MYPLYLALRYARSRAVTYLALFTVAVSVGSFVVVMSVLGGFRHRVEEIIQKTGAPLEVFCGSVEGVPQAAELAADLEELPGVKAAAPYVQTMTLMRTARFRTTALVRGVDLDKEIRFGALGEYLLAELPEARSGQSAREKDPPSHALPDLWRALFPWLYDGPAAPEPAPAAAPAVTSFKVPESLRPTEIPKEVLEPWETPEPPGQEPKAQEPGTVSIWGGQGPGPGQPPPAAGGSGDPDGGRPLPPPPPPPKVRKKPAPKEEPVPRGVIVGAERAWKLELLLGDELILTAQGENRELRSYSFVVVGFYRTKTQWLDEGIFIDRRAAQELSGVPVATGISIWVEDLHGLERVAPEARQVVSEAAPLRRNIQVRTWKETRPDDFAMLEMQDRVMMIILLVLFALDGAFIMAILWVLVSDKTRDIGTVRALGAGRFGVVTTFVLQGLAIGVLGTVLGMAGGLALAEHVNGVTGALDQALGYCGVAPLFKSISANLFGMNRLQVFYDPVHMVSIVATIIAVSILASLAPAWRAARLDPVEALRHD